MKILIIAQYFPPDMGGGATRAYNMAKGLSLVGCDVVVVTAFPHYPTGNIPKKYKRKLVSIETEGKIKIIRTFVPPVASEGITKRIILFTSFILSSLCAIPVVRKVDGVWAANPNIIAMMSGIIYTLINNSPVVQNVDDLWPEALYDLGMNSKSFTAKIFEYIAKITYTFATAITPLSPAYVPILTDKYALQSNKIHVIPAGVDSLMFSNTNAPKKSNSTFRVLYVGAFSPGYDFNQVFEAAELMADYENIEFVIQGGGELAADLKAKVKKIKSRNVQIVDKIINRREVVKELQNADALLLPLNGIGSIEMGISSKLYEYQAVGKPILCCSRGQPANYILESKSGLVIKPGDYAMLSNSILTLINNPKLAHELGASGRKYVAANLSIERIGSKLVQVFNEQRCV